VSTIERRIPLVLHDEFGGFSLTARIHDLLEARGTSWLARCARTSDGRWFLPSGEDELRCDQDLIDVVLELQQELERLTEDVEDWSERRRIEQQLLHGLRVVQATVVIEIDDLDGRERVIVTGWGS
jgi:hypothetical protein